VSYQEFIRDKGQGAVNIGFDPLWMPDFLFDFQRSLVEWAIQKGRAAIFADCGMGKTAMQLTWAENVVLHTGKPVLIVTPLAVSKQTEREAIKFGLTATRSQDGSHRGGIVVTNYERLDNFNSSDFAGVVCDESSILKSFSGSTRKSITRFMSKLPYRLLCTATAAPNDYVELGTSSEALGELNYSEMLRRFFAQLDDKGQKREQKLQEQAETIIEADPSYYQKLAYRVAQTIGQWRLRHHAVTAFWRWVASWARACRRPSDLGFSDRDFILPVLTETDHVIEAKSAPPGMLFTVPAFGGHEERQERKRTIGERTEYVASLTNHDRQAVVWCHTNDEADRLVDAIDGAEQVAGTTSDEERERIYDEFATGSLRVLVIKPKIGAWGMNWQNCNHVVTYASHSYEQYYQSVRRCWRFGQKRPVQLDVVATEGEIRVLGNMRAKGKRADDMFAKLVEQMNRAVRIERQDIYTGELELPKWA